MNAFEVKLWNLCVTLVKTKLLLQRSKVNKSGKAGVLLL